MFRELGKVAGTIPGLENIRVPTLLTIVQQCVR